MKQPTILYLLIVRSINHPTASVTLTTVVIHSTQIGNLANLGRQTCCFCVKPPTTVHFTRWPPIFSAPSENMR